MHQDKSPRRQDKSPRQEQRLLQRFQTEKKTLSLRSRVRRQWEARLPFPTMIQLKQKRLPLRNQSHQRNHASRGSTFPSLVTTGYGMSWKRIAKSLTSQAWMTGTGGKPLPKHSLMANLPKGLCLPRLPTLCCGLSENLPGAHVARRGGRNACTIASTATTTPPIAAVAMDKRLHTLRPATSTRTSSAKQRLWTKTA